MCVKILSVSGGIGCVWRGRALSYISWMNVDQQEGGKAFTNYKGLMVPKGAQVPAMLHIFLCKRLYKGF